MLTCRRLAIAFLALSAATAEAQPAVPAVPPLRSAAPTPKAAPAKPAAKTATPAPTAAAPVIDPDAPPTSDGSSVIAAAPAPARPATAVNAADAPPTSDAAPVTTAMPAIAAASADAPPISDAAPTSTPAAAPTNAVASAAAPAAAAGATPAAPVLPPTVPRNYPITPEGNARFLADYAARPDAKSLEGGVLYRVLQAAPDPKAGGPIARGDTVTVSYRGWLIDGTAFDQTKPGIPVQFTLNGVVPGWRTALMKMKVGDLWEVAVPADQAYGAEGRAGRIPPNQTLIFVISLAKVEYAG